MTHWGIIVSYGFVILRVREKMGINYIRTVYGTEPHYI